MHLARRQALRDRQREAVISGRSVRSVIEDEVEPETTQCPRMTCVQMTPRLKGTHNGVNTAEVYDRLNQSDGSIRKIDKEKPPAVVIPRGGVSEKQKKSSSKESEEYPDERDKVSAEKEKTDTVSK